MTPLTPAEIAAIEERLDFWQRNDTVLDELTRLIASHKVLQAENDLLQKTISRGPDNCYCVCHSPFSSSGYCRHCKGDNEVGQYHELRVLTKELAEALDWASHRVYNQEHMEAPLDKARAAGVLQ